MSAFTGMARPARRRGPSGGRADPPAVRQRHRRPMIDLAGNDYLGLSRHPEVVAARRRGRAPARSRRGRLPPGHRHPDRPRGPRGVRWPASPGSRRRWCSPPATTPTSPSCPRSPTPTPCRLRRPRARVDDRRLPALARRTVAVVPHNDVGAVERFLAGRTPAAGARPRRDDLLRPRRRRAGRGAGRGVRAGTTPCWSPTRRTRSGSSGVDGRGLLHEAGLGGADHVVGTLTLSKSLGSQGGAVLATSAVREHLVNIARPFIYDTGLAPAAAGAALAALGLVGRRARAGRRASTPGRRPPSPRPAACASPPARSSRSPMPGPREAVDAVARAAEQGVRIGCFRPPSTPDGISRLRLTAHAHLTDDEVDHATQGDRGAARVSTDVLFVTGTDTGVGKTVVTAALAVALRQAGRSPYVVKPAQTGVTPDEPGDLDDVRRLAGEVPGHEGVRLREPLAPDTGRPPRGRRPPGPHRAARRRAGRGRGSRRPRRGRWWGPGPSRPALEPARPRPVAVAHFGRAASASWWSPAPASAP